MTIKVLIVDDMATYRSIIGRSLSQIDGVEVVGKVSNGKRALEFIEENPVDLITLDVEMPVMDGLATLHELKRKKVKAEVLMLSGLSDQAAQLTIKCLELGALDFVLKPQTASFLENQNQLVEHMKNIIMGMKRSVRTPPTRVIAKPLPLQPRIAPKPVERIPRLGFARPKICLIGVSTGGPKALAEVLKT